MYESSYWLGFSAFHGIGPARFDKLLTHFGSAKAAWSASEHDLQETLGMGIAQKFFRFRQDFSLSAYAKKLADKKISFLLLKDTNYPQLLAQTPNPPFVLYVKGNIDVVSSLLDGATSIGIVGTRRMTHYGEEVTRFLTEELVSQGFSIVSGLALGVDATAHEVTLEHNGATIAVLGCGVDCCTPSINQPIYDKIIGNFGAIVSESAFGGVASKGMFPSRNRIIAGLSLGVLVTEGTADSGALITATRAQEYQRPVFAVPGQITSTYSKGPLHLIQQGAIVVQSVDDILSVLEVGKKIVSHASRHEKMSEVPEEQSVLQLLSRGALYFDEIVRHVQKDPQTVGSLLSMMEIKGLIKSRGGKFLLSS